jgi:threonine synthase
MVCLATAHPAKFAAAVAEAIGSAPPVPQAIAGITEKPDRCFQMDADVNLLKEYITEHALRG